MEQEGSYLIHGEEFPRFIHGMPKTSVYWNTALNPKKTSLVPVFKGRKVKWQYWLYQQRLLDTGGCACPHEARHRQISTRWKSVCAQWNMLSVKLRNCWKKDDYRDISTKNPVKLNSSWVIGDDGGGLLYPMTGSKQERGTCQRFKVFAAMRHDYAISRLEKSKRLYESEKIIAGRRFPFPFPTYAWSYLPPPTKTPNQEVSLNRKFATSQIHHFTSQ